MGKSWCLKCGNKIYQEIMLMGLFLFVLVVIQGFIHPDFGDDLAYVQIGQSQSLLQFLEDRYHNWSSRLIIETVMLLLVKNAMVWRVLNIAVILLLVRVIADLFGVGSRVQAQFIFFAEIWMVPFVSLNSAGWITTTVNYLWVLTFGILAMRPIKHWTRGENCPAWEYVICPLCVLYAANMEQMTAILFGVYLLFGCWLLYHKRKLSPFFFVQLILIALSLIFILSVPGNAVRALSETERFFPAFADMSMGEKLWMGFLENANYYIAGGYNNLCCLFGCLAGVLAVCWVAKMLRERRQYAGIRVWRRLIMGGIVLFPLILHLCCACFFPYLLWEANISRGRNLLWALSFNRNIPAQSTGIPAMIVVQTFVYLTAFVCVVLTVLFLQGGNREALFQLLILGAGFASRMLMGFSPTIYASGDRTALFCSAAILIVVLRNIQLCLEKNPRWVWKICMGLCLAGGVLYNLLTGSGSMSS